MTTTNPQADHLDARRWAGRVRATIRRSDPTAQGTFDIPASAPMVVLDLLGAAQREDPSLTFRYSCRAGRCGTCTIQLDGSAVLACQIPVAPDSGIRLDPLGGLPVVKDLVVEMTPFATRWSQVVRTMDIDHGEPPEPGSFDRELFDAARECISCGACYAACPVAGESRPFLGPAALTRAASGRARRPAATHFTTTGVLGRAGIAGCHSVGACSIACPRELDPARVIRGLRRIGKRA